MTFDNLGIRPGHISFADFFYEFPSPWAPQVNAQAPGTPQRLDGLTFGDGSTSDGGEVPPLPPPAAVPPPVSEAAGAAGEEAAFTQTPGSEQLPEEPESGDEGEKALLPDFGCAPRLPTGIEWPTPRYGGPPMDTTGECDFFLSKNETLLLGEARALEQIALPQCDVG